MVNILKQNDKKNSIIDDLTPLLEKSYLTSNYLNGGMLHQVLAADFAQQGTKAERYTHYYAYSHLEALGINTISSPHSNKRLNIDKGLIDILRYFVTPKSINEFVSEKYADSSTQNMLVSLIKDSFLFSESVDQDRAFNLLYVEIDPNTVCNHACIYCPVAVDPRKKHDIDEALFDDILSQLSLLNKNNNITVCLCAYNEVTLDDRYPAFAKKIVDKGLNHIVISNGSNLTPALVDTLMSLGVKDFELNIPALDESEFFRIVGKKGAKNVISNVDYMAKKPLNINVLVHGVGDVSHYRNFTALKKRYNNTSVTVTMGKTMDRSGILDNEYQCNIKRDKLAGCTNTGSRLINWLHVNSSGECFLCPMDYNYNYMLGDLKKSSIEEVLSGDKIALYRRYAYGLEAPPDDFMCGKCAAMLSCSWKDISEKDIGDLKRKSFQCYLKYRYESMIFRSSLYLKSRLKGG